MDTSRSYIYICFYPICQYGLIRIVAGTSALEGRGPVAQASACVVLTLLLRERKAQFKTTQAEACATKNLHVSRGGIFEIKKARGAKSFPNLPVRTPAIRCRACRHFADSRN